MQKTSSIKTLSAFIAAMISSKAAYAQSDDPFAAVEDVGEDIIDKIDGPLLLLATIALMVMAGFLIAGRMEMSKFIRIAAGVIIIGIAPAAINYLGNFF